MNYQLFPVTPQKEKAPVLGEQVTQRQVGGGSITNFNKTVLPKSGDEPVEKPRAVIQEESYKGSTSSLASLSDALGTPLRPEVFNPVKSQFPSTQEATPEDSNR